MHVGLAVILPHEYGGIKVSMANVEDVLQTFMERFSEEREVAPYLEEVTDEPSAADRAFAANYPSFTLYRALTAMQEHYQTTDPHELAEKMPDWDGCAAVVVDNRLYKVLTWNREAKWDYWNLEEFWPTLPGGVGYASDVRPHDCTYALLTPDHVWHEKQPRYRDYLNNPNPKRYTDDEWRQFFQAQMRRYPNHIVATLDTHY